LNATSIADEVMVNNAIEESRYSPRPLQSCASAKRRQPIVGCEDRDGGLIRGRRAYR